MATNNEEFEKFYGEYQKPLVSDALAKNHDGSYKHYFTRDALHIWQAARSVSEKEIAELQAQVKQLNEQAEVKDKLINEYQHEINRLDKELILRDLSEMKLRDSAQAVIDRWETPLWKDVPATAVFIYKLRDALAVQFTPTHLQEWYRMMVGEAKPITGKLGDRCSFHSTDIRKGDKVHVIKEFKA